MEFNWSLFIKEVMKYVFYTIFVDITFDIWQIELDKIPILRCICGLLVITVGTLITLKE